MRIVRELLNMTLTTNTHMKHLSNIEEVDIDVHLEKYVLRNIHRAVEYDIKNNKPPALSGMNVKGTTGAIQTDRLTTHKALTEMLEGMNTFLIPKSKFKSIGPGVAIRKDDIQQAIDTLYQVNE